MRRVKLEHRLCVRGSFHLSHRLALRHLDVLQVAADCKANDLLEQSRLRAEQRLDRLHGYAGGGGDRAHGCARPAVTREEMLPRPNDREACLVRRLLAEA